MGSSKIDKEQEKVLYKQMFARALNSLRSSNQTYFHLGDLTRELSSIPKVKKKYIFSLSEKKFQFNSQEYSFE